MTVIKQLKNMKKIILICLFLSGCATGEYDKYASSQLKLNEAKYNAEIAKHSADQVKYNAIAEIAKSGNEASKVAAVMALTMSQMNTQKGESQNTSIQAPRPSELLQWAQVLVPGAIQSVGIIANKQVAINQSNNSSATAIATTSSFVAIAGKIQAPVTTTTSTTSSIDDHTVTTTSTDDHRNTLSGTGTLGSGAYTVNTTPFITPVIITPVINNTAQ